MSIYTSTPPPCRKAGLVGVRQEIDNVTDLQLEDLLGSHEARAMLSGVGEDWPDEGPRRILADWLEEKGASAVAGLIRTSMAEDSPDLFTGEKAEALTHHSRLLGDWRLTEIGACRWDSGGLWARVRPDMPDLIGVMRMARLGWVVGAIIDHSRSQRLNLDYALNMAAALGTRCLEIGGVIYPIEDIPTYLAAWPWLTRLRELHLSCWIDDEPVEALCAIPGLAGVRTFQFSQLCQIGARGMRAIVRSASLSGLRHLHLDWCPNVGLAGVEGIVAPVSASRLQSLRLLDWKLPPEAGRLLGRSPHLTGLRTLQLRFNRLGVGGTKAIANSPTLAGLEVLDLSHNLIGSAGAEALGNSRHLNRLRVLNLADNKIDEDGVRALANGQGLPALQMLDLSAQRDALDPQSDAARAMRTRLNGRLCVGPNE